MPTVLFVVEAMFSNLWIKWLNRSQLLRLVWNLLSRNQGPDQQKIETSDRVESGKVEITILDRNRPDEIDRPGPTGQQKLANWNRTRTGEIFYNGPWQDKLLNRLSVPIRSDPKSKILQAGKLERIVPFMNRTVQNLRISWNFKNFIYRHYNCLITFKQYQLYSLVLFSYFRDFSKIFSRSNCSVSKLVNILVYSRIISST